MKLNINCIRDILLTIKEQDMPVMQKDLKLDNYSQAEIEENLQHLYIANCADIVFADTHKNCENTEISMMTENGHIFTEMLEDNTLFEEFKKVIDQSYPLYDLSIFIYAYHSYLASKYGNSYGLVKESH